MIFIFPPSFGFSPGDVTDWSDSYRDGWAVAFAVLQKTISINAESLAATRSP
jgi:hypothetical protein